MPMNKKLIAETFDKKLKEHQLKYSRGEVDREWFITYMQGMLASALELNLGDTARRYNEILGSL